MTKNSQLTGRCASRRLATALGVSGALLAIVLLAAPSTAGAATPIGLGTVSSFGVLAGAGITNTGPTTITGDIGTFPTTSQSGFGSITETGTNHAGDAVTQQAKTDLTTAYNQAAGSLPATSVANELGGTTLTPGVYNGAVLQLTGTLTLDTQGDPQAVFIFQTGSTLVTASGSNVVVIGSPLACNVYWQVPSSATLGTGSHLVGNVLAATSITATTGATVQGRLLARNGAVTLDTNTISIAGCGTPTTPTTTTTPASGTTPAAGSGTPTPSGSGTPADGSGTPAGPDGPNTPRPSTPATPVPPIPPLAYTGSSTGYLLGLGSGLLLLGTALIALERRRLGPTA